MRQYHNGYYLLTAATMQQFIGTDAYNTYQEKRFPTADKGIPITANEAFLLSDSKTRTDFSKRYKETAALYFNGQPDFEILLRRIHENIDRL